MKQVWQRPFVQRHDITLRTVTGKGFRPFTVPGGSIDRSMLGLYCTSTFTVTWL